MSVSVGSHKSAKRVGGREAGDGTLLFLISIVLGDLSLEEDAIGLIFGLDEYSLFILDRALVSGGWKL